MYTNISSYLHVINLEENWKSTGMLNAVTAAANTYLKKKTNIFLMKYLQQNIGSGSVYNDLFSWTQWQDWLYHPPWARKKRACTTWMPHSFSAWKRQAATRPPLTAIQACRLLGWEMRQTCILSLSLHHPTVGKWCRWEKAVVSSFRLLLYFSFWAGRSQTICLKAIKPDYKGLWQMTLKHCPQTSEAAHYLCNYG